VQNSQQLTDNFLEKVYQEKLEEVRSKKKILPLIEIHKKCQTSLNNKGSRDFLSAIKSKETALICEIKKASPTRGIIRENFNAEEIARSYENIGAACLSVLTDEKYFLGKNEDLIEARNSTSIPILRKDFIVDKYQIYEAKMLGADCVLIIVAMLEEPKLKELEQCAIDLGLAVLIEIHNEQELIKIVNLQSKLIGINNRNLNTLEVNIG
jgi:indole-3-glycerol phosphate synthase